MPNPHIALLIQFTQTLEKIDYNRARIRQLLDDEPNVFQMPILLASIEKLDEIEADVDIKMYQQASLN